MTRVFYFHFHDYDSEGVYDTVPVNIHRESIYFFLC